MSFDSAFTPDERNRIQAVKAQLQWKCTNIHQGNRFRLVANPYKRIHTIYFPKDTSYNPSLYNYLIELTRAFYTEKYGPVFGDPYFAPETDKQHIKTYSALISVSQHWFTAAFCHANFRDIWEKSLQIKYQALQENKEQTTETIEQTLSAALICAQIAWINKQSTSSVIHGSLRDLVTTFVGTDPAKVDTGPVAVLVNNMLELYQKGHTLQFNQQKQGGFWKYIPSSI